MSTRNKLYLPLILAAVLSGGCTPRPLGKINPEKEATLLNKENFTSDKYSTSIYYFDTDDDPETAEIALQTEAHYTYLDMRLAGFNNAKIGQTKTMAQWHKDLVSSLKDLRWHGYKVKE